MEHSETITQTVPSDGLLANEKVLDRLNLGMGNEFILTNQRIMFVGARGQNAFASALLGQVTLVGLRRRSRAWHTIPWAIVGIVSGIVIWSNVADVRLGGIILGVLLLVSLGLLLIYLVQPYSSVLYFNSAGGSIQGTMSGVKKQNMERFVAAFEAVRIEWLELRTTSAPSNTHHPPPSKVYPPSERLTAYKQHAATTPERHSSTN